MPRATVSLFLSHVCDDHVLVREIRVAIGRDNDRGAHPIIRFNLGCPVLSGAPGGSSISGTWQERLASSAGILFLWTRDAPHSEGTAREWRYNHDHAHRPYCFAVERNAILPGDADTDVRRIRLPVYLAPPQGARRRNLFLPRPPNCKHLPVIGAARSEFIKEVSSFARSLLVPLV